MGGPRQTEGAGRRFFRDIPARFRGWRRLKQRPAPPRPPSLLRCPEEGDVVWVRHPAQHGAKTLRGPAWGQCGQNSGGCGIRVLVWVTTAPRCLDASMRAQSKAGGALPHWDFPISFKWRYADEHRFPPAIESISSTALEDIRPLISHMDGEDLLMLLDHTPAPSALTWGRNCRGVKSDRG